MDPVIGQIILFGFGWAPRGWAVCDGSLLQIQQYQALYSLLGNTYGGDGRTTFGLPDLRGRVPVGQGPSTSGTNYIFGKNGGAESMALTPAQMPAHTHMLLGSSQTASSDSLSGNVLATSNGSVTSSVEAVSVNSYAAASAAPVTADPHAISSAGSSAPFNMMPPYLCMNYCIATTGIYPDRP